MTRRAAVRIALLLAAAVLTLPGLALADGDPASDTLLGESVFYPYAPAVPRAVQVALNAQTASAQRAGLPIKVAIIAAPTDLGAVPSLFGEPQSYAHFLDQEISFKARQPLLVVMPAGYGAEGLPAAATRAVSALPKPAGRSSTDLARAAQAAVDKILIASGHPVKLAPAAPNSGRGGGSSTVLLVVLILAAIAVVAALIALRVRRSSS